MKKPSLIFSFIVFLMGIQFGVVAKAQIDPTTSVLFRSNQQDGPGLDSSRYVTKPSTTKSAKTTPVQPVTSPVPATAPVAVAPPVVAPLSSTVTPAATAATTAPTVVAVPATVGPIVAPTNIDSDTSAAQRFLRAGDGVQASDPRLNIANISVAPAFMYVDSASQYWYRRYFTAGPAIDAHAEVWLSPEYGVKFGYLTSLAGDIHADPDTSRSVSATSQILNAGFVFRQYFSESRKSPSIELGAAYDEYSLTVAKDEPNRIRLKKSGIDFSMILKFPVAVNRAWILSSDLMPKLTDTESATAISVSSGSSPSAYAVKVGIGEQFTLDRHNQVFWQLSHRYDKVLYDGPASVNDPITGQKPSGVSVSTGTTLFEVGFSWGG